MQPKEGNWSEIEIPTYEKGEECLKTNYYGSKSMIEAFLPLLQASDSARVVNVSSLLGSLKVIRPIKSLPQYSAAFFIFILIF